MRYRVCTVAIALCLFPHLTGCRNDSRHNVHRSFYYWRSVFDLSKTDVANLRNLSVSRLYVKFFDVDWDPQKESILPEATIVFRSHPPEGISIIPTVYITTDVLRNLHEKDTSELADHIVQKLFAQLHNATIPFAGEVQFDCDWTQTTGKVYFALLRELRSQLERREKHITVSATIRLHQIKYLNSTGVPPVDRGMLMVYNTGHATDMGETNSILSDDEVRKYLNWIPRYPLDLDIALPLYSWGVVFHLERYSGLINNLHPDDLDGGLFRKVDSNLYVAVADCYVHGEHIFSDDVIRIEETNTNECSVIARQLSSRLRNPPQNISLYHFDPVIIARHELQSIQDLYRVFD